MQKMIISFLLSTELPRHQLPLDRAPPDGSGGVHPLVASVHGALQSHRCGGRHPTGPCPVPHRPVPLHTQVGAMNTEYSGDTSTLTSGI